MKQGGNVMDQAMIQKMARGRPETDEQEGIDSMNAAQISKALQIDQQVVEQFMPEEPKPKPRTRKADG